MTFLKKINIILESSFEQTHEIMYPNYRCSSSMTLPLTSGNNYLLVLTIDKDMLPWICDHDRSIRFSFNRSREAPYESLRQSTQQL